MPINRKLDNPFKQMHICFSNTLWIFWEFFKNTKSVTMCPGLPSIRTKVSVHYFKGLCGWGLCKGTLKWVLELAYFTIKYTALGSILNHYGFILCWYFPRRFRSHFLTLLHSELDLCFKFGGVTELRNGFSDEALLTAEWWRWKYSFHLPVIPMKKENMKNIRAKETVDN